MTMLEIFGQAGYKIQKKVLNAWDFGVAQKRERLITVGVREDLAERHHYKFPIPYKYKPVLRDILLDVPESEGVQYSDSKRAIYTIVPPGVFGGTYQKK